MKTLPGNIAAVATAVALMGTAACATSAAAGPTPGLVVITSMRAGAGHPVWDAAWEARFLDGVGKGATWAVVSADGRPAVIGEVPLSVAGANDLDAAANLGAVRDAVQGLLATPADDPQVDDLAALDLARRWLAGRPGPHEVVLADSLLSTTGALTFPRADGALLSADPAAVAAQLVETGGAPDLTGVHVTLVGAGDTAAPQTPLPIPTRAAVIALWRTVLERAGATVDVDDHPVTGVPPPGLPPVDPVPVAAVAPIGADPPPVIVLHDSSVGFLPDQAVLRDEAAAAAAIDPLTTALRSGRYTATVTGTTSSAGDEEGRLALSRDRAGLVRGLLVDGGVDPALLTATGVGTHFTGFVPDRDAGNRLDPVLAALNRQVIVTITRR